MNVVLFVAAGVLAGFIIGYSVQLRVIRTLRRRVRELRNGLLPPEKKERYTTSKLIVAICLVMGFSWVWFSYYLAYTNHEQIAESLSQVAVTEIIGVVLAYSIKSLVENLSKNNHWPDKRPTQTPEAPPEDESGGGGPAG